MNALSKLRVVKDEPLRKGRYTVCIVKFAERRASSGTSRERRRRLPRHLEMEII